LYQKAVKAGLPVVLKAILKAAVTIYVQEAYPSGPPAGVNAKVAALEKIESEEVPDSFFEPAPALAGNAMALRLGQPIYPNMKLIVEFCGSSKQAMFRVDAHDMHLHAKPGSPDEEWLSKVRGSNKALSEKIEAAWIGAGLPTFKGFLRKQLEERKKRAAEQAQ
jgi:hypothetical protein